jgi:hypothetical protein
MPVVKTCGITRVAGIPIANRHVARTSEATLANPMMESRV